jgi:hypothetical protein
MGKYLNIIRQAEGAPETDSKDLTRIEPLPSISHHVVVEPAATHACQVYWKTNDGRILGPAVPEFLAQVGTGMAARFWVVVKYEGLPRWVLSDQLRSKQAFDSQCPVQTIKPIREVCSGNKGRCLR